MSTATSHLTGTPAWAATRAIAVLNRARHTSEQKSDLGTAEARLLWVINDGEPHTLRDISEQLGLEQSTVNRQVNAAIKAGLLDRHRSPEGVYLLSATSEGAERFDRNLDQHMTRINRALDSIPATERDRFCAQLTEFAAAYDEAVNTI